MKPTRRLAVLLTLLAAAGGLVLFSEPPKKGGELAQVTARSSAARAAASVRGEVPAAETAAGANQPQTILAIRPRARTAGLEDAFALNNWNPPPRPSRSQSRPPPNPRRRHCRLHCWARNWRMAAGRCS